MSIVTTILAFTVIVPLLVGLVSYRRLPTPYRSVVYLCGIWMLAEVYSYILRVNNIVNAHISYGLTAIEIYLFATFYATTIKNSLAARIVNLVGISGFAVVLIDYMVFKTPLNTFSLSIEYIVITFFALYLFYEIVTLKSPGQYALINFTFLFYMLSSFPYFFAWEWLRISNMQLLLVLSYVHSFVHAACYQIMAYTLWRSSLSFSVH